MGIQNQVIKPQGCQDSPFFEIRHSSFGMSLFCRFYKKGAFDPKNERFDSCKNWEEKFRLKVMEGCRSK
jgi:hypothetical protein